MNLNGSRVFTLARGETKLKEKKEKKRKEKKARGVCDQSGSGGNHGFLHSSTMQPTAHMSLPRLLQGTAVGRRALWRTAGRTFTLQR